MTSKRRSLELALRVREWRLQEQVSDLAGAMSHEVHARNALAGAKERTANASLARAELQRRGRLYVDQLVHLAQYQNVAFDEEARMAVGLDEAVADTECRRAHVHRLLSERDSFARCVREDRRREANEQGRKEGREADAAWSVRGEYRE